MRMFADTTHPIEFPQFLIDRGFVDESWHNDITAKAVLALRPGSALVVWVAEDDQALRELYGWPKYTVAIHAVDADGEWIDDDAENLCDTDSAEECAAVIDAAVRGAPCK